jgi:hypothetical protein
MPNVLQYKRLYFPFDIVISNPSDFSSYRELDYIPVLDKEGDVYLPLTAVALDRYVDFDGMQVLLQL